MRQLRHPPRFRHNYRGDEAGLAYGSAMLVSGGTIRRVCFSDRGAAFAWAGAVSAYNLERALQGPMTARGYPSLGGPNEAPIYSVALALLTAAAWFAAFRAVRTGAFKRPSAWLLGGFAAGLGLEATAAFAAALALSAPLTYTGVTLAAPLSALVAFRALHGRLWPVGRAATSAVFAAVIGGLAVDVISECCRRMPLLGS